MAEKECAFCGTPVDISATVCPADGTRVFRPQSPSKARVATPTAGHPAKSSAPAPVTPARPATPAPAPAKAWTPPAAKGAPAKHSNPAALFVVAILVILVAIALIQSITRMASPDVTASTARSESSPPTTRKQPVVSEPMPTPNQQPSGQNVDLQIVQERKVTNMPGSGNRVEAPPQELSTARFTDFGIFNPSPPSEVVRPPSPTVVTVQARAGRMSDAIALPPGARPMLRKEAGTPALIIDDCGRRLSLPVGAWYGSLPVSGPFRIMSGRGVMFEVQIEFEPINSGISD